jgi:hypothetical protein
MAIRASTLVSWRGSHDDEDDDDDDDVDVRVVMSRVHV